MAGRLEEHNLYSLEWFTHWYLEVGGKEDKIREEGKHNKSMTRSAPDKDYEHLKSLYIRLKDKHVSTLKKW